MDKMDRLKSEALQSTKFRGHVMGEWVEGKHAWSIYAMSECLKCGKSVQIEITPAPNSIDIGGEAVSMTCK